jgi:hypothetical protein
MARIPASIRTAYTTGFEWPNCDGGMNPITCAATDDATPSRPGRPSAGSTYTNTEASPKTDSAGADPR